MRSNDNRGKVAVKRVATSIADLFGNRPSLANSTPTAKPALGSHFYFRLRVDLRRDNQDGLVLCAFGSQACVGAAHNFEYGLVARAPRKAWMIAINLPEGWVL